MDWMESEREGNVHDGYQMSRWVSRFFFFLFFLLFFFSLLGVGSVL